MLVCVRVYVSERERESVCIYICMFLCVRETVMCVFVTGA